MVELFHTEEVAASASQAQLLTLLLHLNHSTKEVKTLNNFI